MRLSGMGQNSNLLKIIARGYAGITETTWVIQRFSSAGREPVGRLRGVTGGSTRTGPDSGARLDGRWWIVMSKEPTRHRDYRNAQSIR